MSKPQPAPQTHPAAQPAKRGVAPSEPVSPQQAGLMTLLDIEQLVRSCRNEAQLQVVITHETQKVLRCRQCLLFVEGPTGRLQIAAISGLPAVDRTVPIVQALERALHQVFANETRRDARPLDLVAEDPARDGPLRSYAFGSFLWAPFRGTPLSSRPDAMLGGMLLARETPWGETETRIAARLAEPYAYALDALRRRPAFKPSRWLSLRTRIATALTAVAVLAIPVSLTTLAPVEIAPRDAAIVASGLDGVIEAVRIEPNSPVERGQTVARLVDVNVRNRAELAEREVVVADAKIKKWQQMSFGDPRANHELAIAGAELRLRSAERDWAREQLAMSEIKALQNGLALFLDKKDLIGKPVSVGERIMEIADPGRVEARIDVAVADALVLKVGAKTRLFLDSDPLNAREAVITHADYQARVRPNNTLTLRAVALLANDAQELPRLGARGTAQVFGERVPLGYYLFRRPISALRQWAGL